MTPPPVWPLKAASEGRPSGPKTGGGVTPSPAFMKLRFMSAKRTALSPVSAVGDGIVFDNRPEGPEAGDGATQGMG